MFIEYVLKLNQANLVSSPPIFINSNRLLRWQDLIPRSLIHLACEDDYRRYSLATSVNSFHGCHLFSIS